MSDHSEHEEVIHFRPQLGGGAAAEPPPPSVPIPPSPSPAPATAAIPNPKNPNDPLNYCSADEYARAMRERYPHIHAVAGWESAWHVAHARAAAARAEARSEFEAHAREHMAAIAKFPIALAPTGPKFCK
ncbi:hypothetical protein [Sporolituus thermophilus]|uniref:Uncharacterized protein n=1 Tax=Sporolituus thermophilus DSM 23256 TaxID=1123285 RepID=A0A1G7K3G9_9FIRM|nr:hypothetical protein [Sporolituus thermophilus]SDF31783.1 hypothetical protein SAMN05660235_01160 [Sporolituus thermophilus DSM 23256]